MPESTFGLSSPGMRRDRPFHAPMASTTASYSERRDASVTSFPSRVAGTERRAQAEHLRDRLVEHRGRKPVIGDAVTQHAARFLHRLEQRHGHAPFRKVPGGGKTGRPGADDGHFSAVGCRPRPRTHAAGLRFRVGQESLDAVDVERLFHQVPAALLLAGPGADPADDSGHRVVPSDELHRLGVTAVGHQAEVALHVDVGRAGERARRLAVAVVVGKEEVQGHPPGRRDIRCVGRDGHARRHLRAAAGHEPARLFHLHDADPAGGVRLQAPVVAERGDTQALRLGDLEDGLAGLDHELLPVQRDLEWCAAHDHSRPELISMASNRHAS